MFISDMTPADLLVASMAAEKNIIGAQGQDLSAVASQCEIRQMLHQLGYAGWAYVVIFLRKNTNGNTIEFLYY